MPLSGSYPMTGIRILSAIVCLLFSFRNIGAEPHGAREVIQKFCYDCHDSDATKGELNLEALERDDVVRHADVWEKVIRKMNARQMPPIGKRRPNEETYKQTTQQLARDLDRAAEKNPNPGRTETLRRLNRTEYQNAIRDLLDLRIDAAALLPKDEASHGF